MGPEIWVFLGVTIGAGLGALPGLLALRLQRRKVAQEEALQKITAADALTGAALSLVEPLGRRIGELELIMQTQNKRIAELQARLDAQARQIAELQTANRTLCEGVSRLSHQVRALGYEPVWEPAEDGESE